MSDYIKREDAFLAVQQRANRIREDGFISKAIDLMGINDLILSIPSADVVERKKGEWIIKEFMWGDYVPMKCPTCSVCGTHIVDLEMVDKDKRLLFKDGASFCPNCGADMRSCNNEEKMHDTEQTDCPWG